MVKLNMITINESKIIMLMVLGIVRALKMNLLTIDEAQHIIFSPATLDVLQKNGGDKSVMEIIHLGTELEDVKDLIPHQFQSSIEEIERKVFDYLKNELKYDYNAEKIFVKLLGKL